MARTSHAKPCARPHCIRPVLRPDSKYCSRRCGFEQRPTGANNHRIFVKPEPERAADTWWAQYQQDREGFYRTAADRLPTLRARYGSQLIGTHGPQEMGLLERSSRQDTRGRVDRMGP